MWSRRVFARNGVHAADVIAPPPGDLRRGAVAWAVTTPRRRSGNSPHGQRRTFIGDSGVDEGLRIKAASIGIRSLNPFPGQVWRANLPANHGYSDREFFDPKAGEKK
jgi:hypothetical protein